MRTRKLAILGGYGGINIGDEMILRAAVARARAEGWSGEIVVIGAESPSAGAAADDYAAFGLRPVSWRRPFAAARSVAGRDLFIGGGQIIDGVAGVQYPLLQLGLAAIARCTGGRVTIGGVSTARLDAPRVRQAYDGLFRCAHRIVLRDQASFDDVLAITPSAAAKAELKADLVFSMRESFAGGPAVEERTTFAFAVHCAPTFAHTGMAATEAFLRRVEPLLEQGQELVILAHDRRQDWDLGFATELANRLGSSRVSVRAFATAGECIDFYRRVRTVISVRMHPIILAACAGAYCVPLAGSRKVADMATRLKVPHYDLEQLAQLDDVVLRAAIGVGRQGPGADPQAVLHLASEASDVIG